MRLHLGYQVQQPDHDMNRSDPILPGRCPGMELNFYKTKCVSPMTNLGVDWIWHQAGALRIRYQELGLSCHCTDDDLATPAEEARVAQSTEGV